MATVKMTRVHIYYIQNCQIFGFTGRMAHVACHCVCVVASIDQPNNEWLTSKPIWKWGKNGFFQHWAKPIKLIIERWTSFYHKKICLVALQHCFGHRVITRKKMRSQMVSLTFRTKSSRSLIDVYVFSALKYLRLAKSILTTSGKCWPFDCMHLNVRVLSVALSAHQPQFADGHFVLLIELNR